jgi:type VI secretion system secreted protein VgrG
MFQLAVAGSHVPEQRYVVTRVEHEGVAPEELLQGTHDDPRVTDRYKNRFQCVPVETPWRPSRNAPRPVIAGLQTALVVGPAGEEIYTDEHGRIRVQFHWDRHGRRDAHSTCWIRVIQGPWSGAGWGFQFIPRVGMEVAVSFLDGDPDRPVVTGALYNGQNRVPHALPAEKTRSAIRTQSSPNSQGYNELRFEDRAGAEEVYVHAQRDLVEEVLHCHSTRVGATQQNVVLASQVERVGHDVDVVVGRDQRLHVEGRREVTVSGGESLKTLEGRESVTTAFSVDRVEGTAVRHVVPEAHRGSGGDARAAEALRRARSGEGEGPLETWVVEGDRTHRVTGTERVELGARTTHVTHDETLTVSGDAIMSAGGIFAVAAHGGAPGPAVGLALDSVNSLLRLRRGADGLDVEEDHIRLGRVREGLLLGTLGAELTATEGSANVIATGDDEAWGLEVSVDDENAKLTSKAGSTLEVKRDLKLHAKGDLVLENDGGARITLKSSGEVEIRGTRITLKG